MKKIITLIYVLMGLLATGVVAFSVLLLVRYCAAGSDDSCEDEIIKKEFLEAKTEQQPLVLLVSNGETVIPMTIIQNYYYPARWRLTIQWYADESFHERQIYVSQECYETVNIGDWFVYDKEFCSFIEPREKIEN